MHTPTSTLLALSIFLLAGFSSADKCYGSGQWAKQDDVRALLKEACQTMAASNTPGTRTLCRNGPSNVKWIFEWTVAPERYGRGTCEDGMKILINRCHGENSDTRGGEMYLLEGANRSWFKVDPNAGRC